MIIPTGEQIKPLLYGLRFFKEIDAVILLHSKKTKKIALKIEKYLKKLEIVDNVFLLSCQPNNLTSIISSLNKKIEELKLSENCEILINLTGGTKIMSISSYIFSLLVGGKCFYIYKNENESMEFQEVPTIKIPTIDKIKNSKIRLELLDIFDKQEIISIKDITVLLGKKPSTIYYYIEEFWKEGIINKEGKKYKITEFGKLLKRILEYKLLNSKTKNY